MNGKNATLIIPLILALAGPGAGARAAAPAFPDSTAVSYEEQAAKGDDAYQRGKAALDERRWDEAVQAFDEAIRLKGARPDGALYYKAYAQNKLGQRDAALKTVRTLASGYPKSQWLGDAKALEIEVRQGMGQPVAPESQSDQELKMMAINSLLNTDPERALPLLQKILQSNQSSKIKERALFVLAQSGSAPARELLAQIARGNSNPDLQMKALNYLGLFGGKESRQTLAEIYRSAIDTQVKRQILHSYMTSGDREQLVGLAKSEKVPELRRDAIHQLGVLGARAELQQLYQAYPESEMRAAILQALFIGGDVEKLIEVARTEKDPDLRGQAIHLLGVSGSQKTGELLVSIYQSETDVSLRKRAIEGLFVQNNAKALVDLARKETNPEMKKDIVSKLALMHSKEAQDYMMEILSK